MYEAYWWASWNPIECHYHDKQKHIPSSPLLSLCREEEELEVHQQFVDEYSPHEQSSLDKDHQWNAQASIQSIESEVQRIAHSIMYYHK